MFHLACRASVIAFSCAALSAAAYAAPAACTANTRYAIVVHGGELTERLDNSARLEAMRNALIAARTGLALGQSSIDVVENTVRTFEDSGLFNAGKGAIDNAKGFVETDASIMDGNGLRSGAVASMLHVRNPVHAARLVMENGRHVLMVGDRGEAFVTSLGAASVADGYFIKDTTGKPAAKPAAPEHGTVGAAALDRCGHIAAATSTGGYDAKVPGRVGDSPIVGAG